jgi:phosphate-selective porin OprO/OprP
MQAKYNAHQHPVGITEVQGIPIAGLLLPSNGHDNCRNLEPVIPWQRNLANLAKESRRAVCRLPGRGFRSVERVGLWRLFIGLIAVLFFWMTGVRHAYSETRSVAPELKPHSENEFDREIIAEADVTDAQSVPLHRSEWMHRGQVMRNTIHDTVSRKSYHWHWDSGLILDSTKSKLNLKFGGQIQIDGLAASQDPDIEAAIGETEDGIYVRRGQVDISGRWGDSIRFRAQYDVADKEVDFRDVYVDYTGLRQFDGLRVGFFPEPFSLEYLTSSKHVTFVERALPSAFAPGSNSGIMVYDSLLEDRMTWALGGFWVTEGVNDNDYSGWSLTARMTGLPWTAPDSSEFLHLGAAVSFRDSQENAIRFSTRPEVGQGPKYLDTLDIEADTAWQLGAEAAWIQGPLSFQSEFIYSPINTISSDMKDLAFYGYYLSTSFFLTGESRPYRKGVFKAVVPNKDFSVEDGGWGAWEIAARFSVIDLEDHLDVPSAGRLGDLTLGLNWYLNRNTRFAFDYIHSNVNRNDVNGSADMVQTRIQIDF